MKDHRILYPITRRAVAWLMLLLLAATSGPTPVALANTGLPELKFNHARHVNPNFKRPTQAELTKPIKRKLAFSNTPSDLEIFNSRVFFEPLLPIDDKASSIENRALADSLLAFKVKNDPEDVSDLTHFLNTHPKSRWRPSLEAAIGAKRFDTGYITDALKYWESAWNATKSAKTPGPKTIADQAISSLVSLEARLGLVQSLERHLSEIGNRTLTGSVALKVKEGRESLWMMKHRPDISYKCGPYAVNTVANLLSPEHPIACRDTIVKAASTDHGTNLAQVENWSKQVGLKMEMAKRSPGAKFIVPSIVHFAIGHFGAIVARKGNRYNIKDPTFGDCNSLWISEKALESQTDGYFLVPEGALGQGWDVVGQAEAERVWGKGRPPEKIEDKTPFTPKECLDPSSCCSASGSGSGSGPTQAMAVASAFSMNASLTISDTPVGYNPPAGPSMAMGVTYCFNEGNQPTTFTFTNLGFDWSLSWVSYLTIDGSGNLTVRVPGGGYESYENAQYNYADQNSQAYMIDLGGGSYQRVLPDGSTENYTLSDGTNIYMTSIADPQGNAATISHDANYRVTGVTDACGNPETTFSYVSNTLGAAGFYNIASITDGFGRSASFAYDPSTTFLTSITDAGGNVSQFFYDPTSSFINTMTTPYGSTSFYQYTPAGSVSGYPSVGLRVTFPDGTSSVIENSLFSAQTYFWDREATAQYPMDPSNMNYSHCKTTRWLTDESILAESPVPGWIRPALEAPTYNNYGSAAFPTTYYLSDPSVINKPTQVARQISNSAETITVGGTVSTGDVLSVTVSDPYLDLYPVECDYTVQSGDTTSSIASGLAASINNIGMIQAFGMTATAASNVVTIKSLSIATTSYSTSVTGTETLTTATGQNQPEIASLSGTVDSGDSITITVNNSALPGGQESVTYVAQYTDTIFSLTQALAVAINSDTNLQGVGVTATWSNTFDLGPNNVFIQSTSSNNTTYSSSVSGTGSESISFSASTNGVLQTWNYVRNEFGYVVQSTDPVGRYLVFNYASNGIDLEQILTTAFITSGTLVEETSQSLGIWQYNDSSAPHKPTLHVDGSGQQTQYTYNTPFAELATITDANGNTTTLSYDSNGYLTQIQGPLSGSADVTSFDYFGYGPVHSIADSEGYTLTYSYDNLNRLTSTTYPDGTSESTIYDKLDPILHCDRLGRWTRDSYDSLDRLICEQDPLGRTTHYCWCSCGSLESLTDPAGNVTTWNHDLEGRVVEKVYADQSTVSYQYQPDLGLLQSSTDANNQTTNFEYNLDNSLQQKYYQNAVNATSPVTVTYDISLPRPISISNGWGQLSYLYNPYFENGVGNSGGDTIESNLAYIYVGGCPNIPNPTDTINVTFYNSALSGGEYTLPTLSVPSGDAGNSVDTAADLYFAIDSNSTLTSAGFTASVSGTMVIITAPTGTTLTVSPSATGSTTASVGGGGRLAQVTNSIIANSPVTYSYDALGRTTNRTINGGNNNIAWGYDAMSRITSEANVLGTFGYSYVDDVSGSSKGTSRLASISYPNGQTTNFTWYGNTGDQRLQSINNLLPSGAPLSQFSYGYDPAGEITRWGQQSANLSPRIQNLGYDAASQLTSSQSGFGAAPPKYADQFNYAYDCASNRTAVQTALTQTANITGTVTSGNTLTIVVNDPALSGGTESVNYVVQSGDSLSSIATNLAAAIIADTNLQAIGVSAVASSNQIKMRSASANLTSYSESVSSGATESIALGISTNAVQNATINGTVTTGNVLTLKVFDAALSGGTTSVSYTAASGNTLSNIASGLASAVNGSSALSTAGITATATQNVVDIKSTSSNLTTYSQGVTSGGTESIYLALNMNGPQTVLVGGSKTTGDVLGIAVFDATLSGGTEAVSYSVGSSDTLTTIAAALTSAINSDTNLQGIGVSATSSGTLITLSSVSTGVTSYRVSRPNTATETLVQGLNPNGVQTAVISGSKSTGDTLTLTIFDAGLSGGFKAETYSVLSGDTLTSIASGLAGVINGDSALSALGITASSASTVVNIQSASNNLTTYAKSTSGGATETITLSQSTGITQYAFNNLNELTSTSGGGAAHFQGTTNKPIVSAKANSTGATLPTSTSFNANPVLSSGNNAATVNIVDGNNNSVTNTYQVGVLGGPSASLTFDANGNMTTDQNGNTNSYDAENRLIKVTYPGTNNYSTFVYDGLGRNVEIVETRSGSVTSTQQFVWCGDDRCEARNSSGTVTAQFFDRGENIGGTPYFFTLDRLGSKREVTNSSGAVVCVLNYDPFGRPQVQGSVLPDFQFAGYYFHAPSGLSLTRTRAYSASLGRWLSRDTLEEDADTNLYAYVNNFPSGAVDPLGTDALGSLVLGGVGAALGGVILGSGEAAGGTLAAPGVGTVIGGVSGWGQGAAIGGALGASLGANVPLGQLVRDVAQNLGLGMDDLVNYAKGKGGNENVGDTGVLDEARELIAKNPSWDMERALDELMKGATGEQKQKIQATQKQQKLRNKKKRC